MNTIRNFVTRFTHATKQYGFSHDLAEYAGQAASDIIRDEVAAIKPSMICRFGMNEIECMIGYCNRPSLKNYIRYFNCEISSVGFSRGARTDMARIAGFFPSTPKYLSQFAELMIEDMKDIDILGSWMKQEKFFAKQLSHVKKVRIEDLEPFYHKDPWSVALENKKVLVIHPFEDSIRIQYDKRKQLFQDARVLPDFELETMKSVQSLADSRVGFKTWFDALEYMKTEINQREFDIAIIGCGAYGFPLAAFVKRMKKKAIHMGGATQLLFGIKGSRWESREFYQRLFNPYWIRPLPQDHPVGYAKVENGCYW